MNVLLDLRSDRHYGLKKQVNLLNTMKCDTQFTKWNPIRFMSDYGIKLSFLV